MRKTALAALTTIAVIGAVTLTGAPAQAAPTTFVVSLAGSHVDNTNGTCSGPDDPTYTTIQSAADAANDGDTVLVCAGTYAEVSSARALHFEGARHGEAAHGRSGPETIVDGSTRQAFDVNGDGTTIDGFTLIGATDGDDTPAVELAGPNETVENTIFFGDSAATQILSDSDTFTRNDVSGGQGIGVEVTSNTSNTTVSDSYFVGNNANSASDFLSSAVDVEDVNSTGISGLTVTGNTDDITGGGSFMQIVAVNGVDIEDNVVTGSTSSGIGIDFGGINDVITVRHNTFSGIATEPAISFNAAYTFALNGGGTIESNAFLHNFTGIATNTMADDLTVDSNIFFGNVGHGADVGYAIDNNTASPHADVDADNNYFGCNAGPGASGCDAVNDNGSGTFEVNHWLVLGSSASPSSLPVGGTTTYVADLNHDNGGLVVTPAVLNNVLTANFAFTNGTVSPSSAPIIGGVAQSTLTATAAGAGTATVTVDNSASSLAITVGGGGGGGGGGLPALTIHDATTLEGNSGTHQLTFNVTLSKAGAKAITVHFATANSSATGGSDFVAKSGILTIAKGKRSAVITILIKGDKTKEANETFAVSLFTPSTNARIADSVATGVIRNDD